MFVRVCCGLWGSESWADLVFNHDHQGARDIFPCPYIAPSLQKASYPRLFTHFRRPETQESTPNFRGCLLSPSTLYHIHCRWPFHQHRRGAMLLPYVTYMVAGQQQINARPDFQVGCQPLYIAVVEYSGSMGSALWPTGLHFKCRPVRPSRMLLLPAQVQRTHINLHSNRPTSRPPSTLDAQD